MPAETGPKARLLITALQSPSEMELNEVSLKGPPVDSHFPAFPEVADEYG